MRHLLLALVLAEVIGWHLSVLRARFKLRLWCWKVWRFGLPGELAWWCGPHAYDGWCAEREEALDAIRAQLRRGLAQNRRLERWGCAALRARNDDA